MRIVVGILAIALIAFIVIVRIGANDLKKAHLQESIVLLKENVRLKQEVNEIRIELKLSEEMFLYALDSIRSGEVVRRDSIIKYYEKNRKRILRINADSTVVLFSERFR